MKAFIQDRERLLDSASDLLKTGVYAENLVKVIEKTPIDKVFTIGLFGGWGTGKSSIIKTAQDKIENQHKNIKFITYDAWKYANDSFRRMFLLKIQQELGYKQKPLMQSFYANKSEDVDVNTSFSYPKLFIGLFVALLLMIGVIFLPIDNLDFKIFGTSFIALCTLYYNILIGAVQELRVNVQHTKMFAPEQFEACFKNMMSKCLKERSWINKQWTKLSDYVETGDSSIIGLEKLVIVIDNIDRCPSDMAYQLLTDIKTFLSNAEYNLVFIVPVDDEALKKHLFRRWNKQAGEEINKEKEEFLRKFFNVTLRIKPHQETELQHFAHEINKENKLGYTSDTLAIVAKEFSDNPRRIIQLLNNLSGELALYPDEFVANNETAICAVLILREEYPEFYNKATKNLDVVRKFNEEEAKEKDDKLNEGLKAFMRVADAILKKTSLESLQKIFTNTSSIFSDLPSEIKHSVCSFDIAKVIEFADSNTEKKNNLVDYALERLKTDVKYSATSQTTQWIDFFAHLYKANIFDSSKFASIDNSLSAFYSSAIPTSNTPDDLCYMCSQMKKVGIDNLHSSIVEYLNVEDGQDDGNFKPVLKGYLTYLTSEQDCKDVASVVERYYTDNLMDKDINFTENQKKQLFGDSFVVGLINSLTTMDNTKLDDIIWCVKNNNDLSSETFRILFSKLIELFGSKRGKSKEEFVEFVDNIQPILNIIRTSSLSEEPKDIYNFIVDVRGIPNPSWPHQSQRDTQRSILDEVDEEESKKIVAFCYEVMRISSGTVNVSTSINKLYSKCKDSIIEGALMIHSLNISIAPLATTLIQVDNYESKDDLYILEILFVSQDDINMFIEEDTIKSKIYSLVDNSGIDGVEKLLSKLVKKEFILTIVTEYVAGLDSETINSLPTSIAKYAVSTFDKKNAETYKDNPNFLILVLKQGNAQQKKEVVRLMKDKINKETDLDNVILVLENLVTDNHQMLKTLIAELEGLKESETISDETKNRIKNLITKLSSYINKTIKTNKFFKLKLK